VIAPVAGLEHYDEINGLVTGYITKPDFYSESAVIFVYDTGLGYQAALAKTNELKAEYPYANIKFEGTLYSDKTGNVVYDHTDNQNPYTVQYISKDLKATTAKPDYISTNLYGEEVTVLLGIEVPDTSSSVTSSSTSSAN